MTSTLLVEKILMGMTSTLLVEKILMADSRESVLSGDVAVICEVGKTCMSKYL